MASVERSSIFSDMVAGYVTSIDDDDDSFSLRTSAGNDIYVYFTGNTLASIIRNFGEARIDVTGRMRDHLIPERYLYAYGLFYPENDAHRFEVKQIVFTSGDGMDFVFEEPNWWIKQAASIADFYLRGQFPDGKYDWRKYRTKLTLGGAHTSDRSAPDFRQETDTISRLVYGLATAYLLTGEDRFLEAAEGGTEYLREHMRATNEAAGIVYWYHGIDVIGDHERKILASEFGDDYEAIPMYEQIYALAGPTQTYRITGDPRIFGDIEKTLMLFSRFYYDEKAGGYFSHLDSVTLEARSDALGQNRARKNWNSIGDHAPAYLINALLATGREDFERLLVIAGETILERFPDDDKSPFVQERFHEDWRADRRWGWQQDNAVVGHNLKIAWNLMRIHHLHANDAFVELATKIAAVMPAIASDQQRGGWYDVMERTLKNDQERHRLVWHDRKAWWQQEQAILAYLILYGSLGDPEHRRLAREAAAFYNAFFLDHDEGGIYFNVLASGTPYLVGNERLKGSHSMSGYHSIELCYLATVYTNLLITQEPLELHFKPLAAAFPDRVLRVAPDLLPPGSVRLTDVWIDDKPYDHFDARELLVYLPDSEDQVRVRVRIAPSMEKLDIRYEVTADTVTLTCRGILSPDQVPKLRRWLEEARLSGVARISVAVDGVESISRDAVHELVCLAGKLEAGEDFGVVGANRDVAAAIREAGAGAILLGDDHAVGPGSGS